MTTSPLLLVAFALVLFFSRDRASHSLQDVIATNMKLDSKNLKARIDLVLGKSYAQSVLLARMDVTPESLEFDDPKTFIWYADEIVPIDGAYAATMIADADGLITGINGRDRQGKVLEDLPIGKTIADYPWFREAIRVADFNKAIWVPLHDPVCFHGTQIETTKVFGWTFSVLDTLDDEPIGSVTLLVSVNHLKEIIAEFIDSESDQEDTLAFVVDGTGRSIVHSGNKALQIDADDLELNNKEGSVPVWTREDGTQYFAVVRPLGVVPSELNWNIWFAKKTDLVARPIEELSHQMGALSLLGILLALLGVSLVILRIVRPLRRLTEITSGYRGGSSAESIPVHSTDEVGMLSHAFNDMIDRVGEAHQGLEDKVQKRTVQLATAKREVSDILDNMSQGIFTFREGGVVNNEFSAYCKELFGGRPIAGDSFIDLFQITEAKDKSAYVSMEHWVDTVIGADDLQWIMLLGEPIKDLVYTHDDDEERHLKLDYKPIYEDEIVTKVMVVATDMSDVVKLAAEVVETKQQSDEALNRAAEISTMDPDIFETFIEESYQILEQCEGATAALANNLEDPDVINKLFRYMHTLKGNARIFKITTVQDMAHSVEDYFQKVRDGEVKLDAGVVDEVQNQVGLIRNLIKEFEILGRRILLGETTMLDEEQQMSPVHILLNDANTYVCEANDTLVRFEENRDRKTLIKLRQSAEVLKNQARNIGVASLVMELANITNVIEEGNVAGTDLPQAIARFQEAVTRSEVGAMAVQACTLMENFSEESDSFLNEWPRSSKPGRLISQTVTVSTC
jgi:HPt (histidine-containing phosphotransfer) domain-containing protein/HAMP domain-containing protein